MTRKKWIRVTAALAVIILVTIGGTLAYLHTMTPTASNTFSSDKSISLQLREPAWDGYELTDEQYGDGTAVKPGLSADRLKTLGFTQAQSYVPGQKIPKDPTVINNGINTKEVPIYTALKIEYLDGEEIAMNYQQFKEKYLIENDLSFNLKKWSKIEQNNGLYDVYRYKTVLETQSYTEPLFTEVPISLEIPMQDGKLPAFKIKVTAYAIQSLNVETENVNDILLEMIQKN